MKLHISLLVAQLGFVVLAYKIKYLPLLLIGIVFSALEITIIIHRLSQ